MRRWSNGYDCGLPSRLSGFETAFLHKAKNLGKCGELLFGRSPRILLRKIKEAGESPSRRILINFINHTKFLKIMISIIIPTLNEERHIPKLFRNIKDQNFGPYEIIVADFNSKDKTRFIARKNNCKLVEGGLPPKARNNGAKRAKGDLLIFFDADSLLSKNFFKNSLKEIKERKLNVGSCRIYPISDNLIYKILFAMFNFWITVTQCCYPNASGSYIFCERNLHNKISGFNENLKLSEDMDYVKRAGKYGKFRILRSVKSYTSVRRFKKEGKLNLSLKLLLSSIYRIIFGEIKTDIFRYRHRHKKH